MAERRALSRTQESALIHLRMTGPTTSARLAKSIYGANTRTRESVKTTLDALVTKGWATVENPGSRTATYTALPADHKES